MRPVGRRCASTQSGAGRAVYTLVPLLGIGVDLVILVRCFFIEALSQGALGRSAMVFDLLCAAAAGEVLLRKTSTPVQLRRAS